MSRHVGKLMVHVKNEAISVFNLGEATTIKNEIELAERITVLDISRCLTRHRKIFRHGTQPCMMTSNAAYKMSRESSVSTEIDNALEPGRNF